MQHFFKEMVRKNIQLDEKKNMANMKKGGYMILQFLIVTTCRIAC